MFFVQNFLPLFFTATEKLMDLPFCFKMPPEWVTFVEQKSITALFNEPKFIELLNSTPANNADSDMVVTNQITLQRYQVVCILFFFAVYYLRGSFFFF